MDVPIREYSGYFGNEPVGDTPVAGGLFGCIGAGDYGRCPGFALFLEAQYISLNLYIQQEFFYTAGRMILFFLLLVLVFCLLLCGGRALPAGGECGSYLSRQHTSMMNGVFIWLVFLRHFSQYHPNLDAVDAWLLAHDCLGQLIVAPFFFFSGWGIMSSLQSKGKVYLRQLLLSRFPGLWVKFAIAVLLFAMLQWLLGVEYPWQQVLISLIGWCFCDYSVE